MDRPQAERLYDSGKEPTVAKLLEYDEQVKQLKNKISQLEKNSQTSSKPPSSDSPQDKKSKQRDKNNKNGTGRKPGGQLGHKGVARNLIPSEEVQETVHYYPDQCKQCGKSLPQDETANVVGEPLRWQVTEIEPIKPTIIEHQCHTTLCECGCCTTATLPPGVGKSNFGPRLTAIIAYLTAVLHVPRRGTREFCEILFNVTICLGSVQNQLETTSKALEPIEGELKNVLPQQPVINADETSWRDRWLWIFVTSTFIYFHIAKTRGSDALREVFGEIYHGIFCVDRWGAYTKYHKGLMQICWAHLKRDFQGILKIGQATQAEDAIAFAQTMLTLRKKVMAVWYQFKEGYLSRAQLIENTQPLIEDIKQCLKDFTNSQDKCAKSLAKKLLKRFDHLFTFILYEGVEPTNNLAERGIRPAVQWRKICFGNRSDNGAVLTSRLLTVTRTCWLQKRNPLEFLVEAITAHRTCNPFPSLL